MSILIIQPKVPSYRIEFFKKLAISTNGFTLLHFGDEKRFDQFPLIHEITLEVKQFLFFKYIKGLKKIVRKYDVIIPMFDPHWINCFLAPILYPKKKIIYWGHGFGRNKTINRIRLKLARKASGLITYSRMGANDFLKNNIDPSKIFIAPNTLWISNHEDLSSDKKNSFLFVGRLQERKKLRLLLVIFADIVRILEYQYNINIHLNIIGNGEFEKNILKEDREIFDLEKKVNFIEGTSDDEILKKYFSEAYAYVSLGAVGLGVLHSFAYGVPVITMPDINHGPEFENIIHGQNGWICYNYADLRSLLFHLVKEYEPKLEWELDWKWGMRNNLPEYIIVNKKIEELENKLNEKISEKIKFGINREIEVMRKKLEYMPTTAQRIEISRNAYQYYVNQRQIEDMVEGFNKAIHYVK